jgi:hypothetical protein
LFVKLTTGIGASGDIRSTVPSIYSSSIISPTTMIRFSENLLIIDSSLFLSILLNILSCVFYLGGYPTIDFCCDWLHIPLAALEKPKTSST